MSLIDLLFVGWDWSRNFVVDRFPGGLLTKASSLRAPERLAVEMHNNHIYVPVRSELSRPLYLVLDTGADTNALNARLGEDLRVDRKIEISLSSAGTGEGTTKLALTRNVWLDLAGMPLRFNVLGPLHLMETRVGRSVDGVLGAEVFYRSVVEIDYQARSVTLHNPGDYRYAGEGDRIPLDLAGRRPFVHAWIELPDGEKVVGKFIIDSGDSGALSLHTPFVERHNLLARVLDRIPHFTHGIGGESREYLGRVVSLQLGGAVLKEPVAAFSQAEKGSKAEASYDGAIGGEVLRRFRTIFDYTRRQMILERNSDFHQPFDVDMSGVDLVVEGMEFDTVRVNRVFEGTPAHRIGLQAGDQILEIDGAAANAIGLEGIESRFRRDGVEHALKVRRDGEPLDLVLKTRRLV